MFGMQVFQCGWFHLLLYERDNNYYYTHSKPCARTPTGIPGLRRGRRREEGPLPVVALGNGSPVHPSPEPFQPTIRPLWALGHSWMGVSRTPPQGLKISPHWRRPLGDAIASRTDPRQKILCAATAPTRGRGCGAMCSPKIFLQPILHQRN